MYNLINIDPPWRQSKGGRKKVRKNSSGMPLDYKVISLEEIGDIFKNILDNHTEENTVVFMWTIEKYLRKAENILKDNNLKLHARMIWNKVTGIPAAFTIRYGHDYLLYAYKGKLLPVAKSERGKIHSVFTEQVTRHSKKPEISYQIMERLYPDTEKLEMFARQKRDGWDVWGDEVENDIIL